MPAAVRPDVLAFFERFQRASDTADPAALTEVFDESFLSLDPAAARPVSRDALIRALPARGQLFASIGASGADLAAITESPLDDQHTLVKTGWTVRFGGEAAGEPLTLRSTFLLRRDAARDWRIVLYLNHQDIAAVIRARATGQAGS